MTPKCKPPVTAIRYSIDLFAARRLTAASSAVLINDNPADATVTEVYQAL